MFTDANGVLAGLMGAMEGIKKNNITFMPEKPKWKVYPIPVSF